MSYLEKALSVRKLDCRGEMKAWRPERRWGQGSRQEGVGASTRVAELGIERGLGVNRRAVQDEEWAGLSG